MPVVLTPAIRTFPPARTPATIAIAPGIALASAVGNAARTETEAGLETAGTSLALRCSGLCLQAFSSTPGRVRSPTIEFPVAGDSFAGAVPMA